MLEMITENTGAIIFVMTVLGGLIGKLLSDKGKKALVKELTEANNAMVTAAKHAAPGWDLAFNMGVGNIPVTAENLAKLKTCASTSWVDAQNLSNEVKDVLDQFAVEKGVTKP